MTLGPNETKVLVLDDIQTDSPLEVLGKVKLAEEDAFVAACRFFSELNWVSDLDVEIAADRFVEVAEVCRQPGEYSAIVRVVISE